MIYNSESRSDMNNNNISCSFGKSKTKEYKIPRKHQNQNLKEDKIYDIKERSFQLVKKC